MASTTEIHSSIFLKTNPPPVTKCTVCCARFHCPLCPPELYKSQAKCKVLQHLEVHKKNALQSEDFYITRCHQACRTGSSGHFHCPFCSKTVIRREDAQRHLEACRSLSVLVEERSGEMEKLSDPIPDGQEDSSEEGNLQEAASKDCNGQEDCSPSLDNPPRRVQRTKSNSSICQHCNVEILKQNMKKHIYRKHTDTAVRDINAESHLDAECIDVKNGIYAVKKSFLGPLVPLHVQKKTWGNVHHIKCESNECQTHCDFAVRSGITFQCHHVRSLDYCKDTAIQTALHEDTLNNMVKTKWFGENKKRDCLQLQLQAAAASVPVTVDVSMKSEHKRYISVYEPTVSYYSRLGRVMVTYDTRLNTWHCLCAGPRMSCIHKYMAKWHLFETQGHLFRKVRSTEMTSENEQEPLSETVGIKYPPEDDQLHRMVSYIHSSKKYPPVLPDNVLSVKNEECPRKLIPLETVCSACPGNIVLGPPVIITKQAQIVSLTAVLKGVHTHCKECSNCGMLYRYQEYQDGLHNFDDGVILTLNLCIFLRNSLQAHTAVGRVFDAIEDTVKTVLPSRDRLLHAYLHFEALTAHEYKYSCVNCGNFPPVVVMDLHKKGVFSLPFSDLEPVPEDFTGEVNCEDFWDSVSMDLIGRGLTSSNRKNPFTVHPSYQFWAPWIGRGTRRSNTVLNTEFRKAQGPRHASEADDIGVTEDRLVNELMTLKVDAVRKLCNECGVDSNSKTSKMDLILRLRTEMQNRQAYDRVFEKIWGASGGLAAIMCPCGVVYSIKFNIRAEGPRDFADLLLSWKHLPNVSVYDFARGLANHTNVREAASKHLPFQPHEGRLAPPTDANIKAAKDKKLKIHLPWLLEPNADHDEDDSHPITKSSKHYVLCDKLHESNSKDEKDILRRIELVPELAGQLNSQVAEQFFSEMRKNNYFMNNMAPSAHIFLVRNIIHHYNGKKERATIAKLEKKGLNVSITLDTLGRVVAAQQTSPEQASVDTPQTSPDAPKSVETSPDTAQTSPDTPQTSPDTPQTSVEPTRSHAGPTHSPLPVEKSGYCTSNILHLDGYSASEPNLPWEEELNSAQYQLLDYILHPSPQHLAEEIIVKEGDTCLTREEFQSLGLQRDMDSNIGNACMKLIQEEALQHAKDIYIADLYLVPTWKYMQAGDHVNLPDDIDMKHLVVFPAWSKANTGPDHYVLCDLPGQMFGNDCGVFMLMYTRCLVTSAPFNFKEGDMPCIRKWWCVRLMERFETEGEGKRFAHWTSQADALRAGNLRPIYHVPTSRGVSRDIPQHTLVARKRKTAEDDLLDVIKAGGTDKRLKAVLTGEEPSKWLDRFLADPKYQAPFYFRDDEQAASLFSHLSNLFDTAPTKHCVQTKIEFLLSVLYPEATICAIAQVQDVNLDEAERVYLDGPGLHQSEVDDVMAGLAKQLRKEGNPPPKRPKTWK